MRVLHVLRKPLSEGTVASNTLKHGTGGLNIDASRISSDGSHMVTRNPKRKQHDLSGGDRDSAGAGMFAAGSAFTPTNHAGGRWPANVILQHIDGCRYAGTKRVKGGTTLAGRMEASPVTTSTASTRSTHTITDHVDTVDFPTKTARKPSPTGSANPVAPSPSWMNRAKIDPLHGSGTPTEGKREGRCLVVKRTTALTYPNPSIDTPGEPRASTSR